MGTFIDLTGQRFGQLTVISRAGSSYGNVTWNCLCECGKHVVVKAGSLRSGNTKSCGCLKRQMGTINGKQFSTTHGSSHSRLYSVWRGMKARCTNPKHKHYKHYGGRGIRVCDEWYNDFAAFQAWAVSQGYNPNALKGQCTIDRINVNGDYCPDNCRWVDMKAQRINQRRRKKCS